MIVHSLGMHKRIIPVFLHPQHRQQLQSAGLDWGSARRPNSDYLSSKSAGTALCCTCDPAQATSLSLPQTCRRAPARQGCRCTDRYQEPLTSSKTRDAAISSGIEQMLHAKGFTTTLHTRHMQQCCPIHSFVWNTESKLSSSPGLCFLYTICEAVVESANVTALHPNAQAALAGAI